jgi:hypothetical protein
VPVLDFWLFHFVPLVLDAVDFEQNLTEYLFIGYGDEESLVALAVIILLQLDCDDSSRQVFNQNALPLHIRPRLLQIVVVEL